MESLLARRATALGQRRCGGAEGRLSALLGLRPARAARYRSRPSCLNLKIRRPASNRLINRIIGQREVAGPFPANREGVSGRAHSNSDIPSTSASKRSRGVSPRLAELQDYFARIARNRLGGHDARLHTRDLVRLRRDRTGRGPASSPRGTKRFLLPLPTRMCTRRRAASLSATLSASPSPRRRPRLKRVKESMR
jgi:hypothetical protein